MENFFGILKTEMSCKHEFKSTEHLISESESYTDDYNKSRIKCKLKGLSPVQYRIQSSRAAYLNYPNWGQFRMQSVPFPIFRAYKTFIY